MSESATEPDEMTPVSIADPDVSDRALERVETVLESGSLADGEEVRAFEEAFASYCETAHGVATSNGTTALHAALEALGVESGDAVITSPFSFVASANAIRLAGGTPVFADIDPMTYTIDPSAVETILTDREDVVGLLPVHLYGLPAAMDQLTDLAGEHDLFVLEDACQAHGAKFDGKPAGSLGDAACFSFYPTKNMTTGEGGMITTDDPDLADRAASFVNHGRVESETGVEHRRLGSNYRLTNLAAAIGRVQLERLPTFTQDRREHAARYDEAFEDVPIGTPAEPADRRHVYHQYTIRIDERAYVQRRLTARDVGTAIYYDPPIHRQPAYETVSTAVTDLPEAEQAAQQVLSLPVHPGLSERQREHVIQSVREVCTDPDDGRNR